MSSKAFARKEPAVSAASKSWLRRAAPTALRIGEPDDAYEREADRVADEIMAGGPVAGGWSLSTISIDAPLQRKCSCSGASGECEECKKKEEEKTVRRKAIGSAGPEFAPPIVHEVLNSPGQPLDKATRDFFEPRFGHDFSMVRVHSGGKSAESARSVGATAYTVGSNVVFGGAHYSPSDFAGKRLLAHELTHVAQQDAGGARCLQRQQQPVPGADWRDVARRKVPYQQWTQQQKEDAERDRTAAGKREIARIVDPSQRQALASNEASDTADLDLLRPYDKEMKAFYEKTTVVSQLDISATFVSTLTYESTAGKPLKLKAYVTIPRTTTPPLGEVLFEVFKENRGQVEAGRAPLPGPCAPGTSTCDVTASYTTIRLSPGKYTVKATYKPLGTGNRSSYTERIVEVK